MAICSIACTAKGTGFDLPDQDAYAIGRGMAFVATADNPSAIYYNPAGITQLQGNNLRMGVFGISLEPTYESPSGESFDNDEKLHGIPQFYYTRSLDNIPVSFGVGFYAPFGLGVQWPQDTGFRTLAIESKMAYYTANPVIAWRVLPGLSIAGGLQVSYAKVDLHQGMVWPEQNFDSFRFKADAWDVGYNVGILWKVHEKLYLGGTFRSEGTMGLSGHTEFFNREAFPPGLGVVPAFPEQRVAADADFPTPMKFIVGISYRPTPKWNIEFNADYTDWSGLNTINLKQSHAFPPLLPESIPLVLEWEPTWYYEFGVTRFIGENWLASAGYILNENSMPDANYSPFVADQERHFFSVGVGFRGRRYDVDLAYQFGYGPDRTVSGSAASAIGQTADGTYSFISHAVALSATLRF